MPTQTDPVCGKTVDQSKAGVEALVSQHEGKTYYFCSMACKLKFDQDRKAQIAAMQGIQSTEVGQDEVRVQA